MTYARKFLIPALLTISWIAMPALAQDKAKAAAADKSKAAAEKKASEGTRKVLVDNDKVLVTEVSYKPGEGSTMSERGPRVTRALTSGTMERTSPDGKKTTIAWKAGEVKYFPKETFANKNVGKTDVVLFVTALK
jgi:hypothetical protein